MLLLAIDTSTSAITVALAEPGRVIASRSVLDARRHSEHLAPTLRAVLREAGARPGDLTDVAVGTGPGPFTGLRVGIVTALTLGHARGIPVHGVCSLDALAREALTATGGQAGDGAGDGELLVATDARRKEVYWATYAAAGGLRRTDGPHVARPADLPARVRALPTVGRGPLLHPDHLGPGREPLDVDAAALADLAATRLAAGITMPVEPLYLRRPDAAEPAAPKSTLLAPPGAGAVAGPPGPGRGGRP